VKVHNPKKPPLHGRSPRELGPDDLSREMSRVAARLVPAQESSGIDGEENLPCWIEPRQLIRILAPFVSMN
jgi:hypothetical protein